MKYFLTSLFALLICISSCKNTDDEPCGMVRKNTTVIVDQSGNIIAENMCIHMYCPEGSHKKIALNLKDFCMDNMSPDMDDIKLYKKGETYTICFTCLKEL